MMIPSNGSRFEDLIEAALDQRRPNGELVAVLQHVLTARRHPARDRQRDPKPRVPAEEASYASAR
jgi:hypothetical protein